MITPQATVFHVHLAEGADEEERCAFEQFIAASIEEAVLVFSTRTPSPPESAASKSFRVHFVAGADEAEATNRATAQLLQAQLEAALRRKQASPTEAATGEPVTYSGTETDTPDRVQVAIYLDTLGQFEITIDQAEAKRLTNWFIGEGDDSDAEGLVVTHYHNDVQRLFAVRRDSILLIA